MNHALLRGSIRLAGRVVFSRSGGPGGQNVNKVNTKVTLRLRLDELLGLSEAEAARLRAMLSSRLSSEGDLIIASSEERSQRVNLERAYARAEALIVSAARLPKHRRPTRPSRTSKEKRLQSKKHRALIKTTRRPPAQGD